jgi:endoglucanase
MDGVKLDTESTKFFEKLCNSFGPSGFEREPASIVKDYVSAFADEIFTDKLGSLIFKKKGSADKPVILLPGHIDEIGFVISGIDKQGFLTFNTIGGWFDQLLLGQRVLIKTEKKYLPGVISAKPPHLLGREEREKAVQREKMYIDIGCSNSAEVKKLGVRIGDPAVPMSDFTIVEKPVMKSDKKQTGTMKLAFGKAFDDRVGTFIAIEVIRRLCKNKIKHPNTVVGAATVQEEVGARGARTTAYMIKPDACITLEVDIAGDVPGIDMHEAVCKIGEGPTILTFDASMIPNQPLKEMAIKVAEKQKIPYQLSSISKGGTDAGIIHISHAGCPSIVLGIPTRHIHSHMGILSLTDVEHCINLVLALIKQLDLKTVEKLTAV